MFNPRAGKLTQERRGATRQADAAYYICMFQYKMYR